MAQKKRVDRYTVYKHTSPSGKVYIGITHLKPEKRWNSGRGYKGNIHFTNAINKYGWDNFKHEILFENLSKEEACQKEIELIAFYKSNDKKLGYNQSIGGEINSGWHLSDEAKRKISENNARFNLGKHLSEETKKKIGNANKGRKYSEDVRKRNSEGHKGIKRNQETRRKMSEATKNRPDEWRQKLSENNATPKVAQVYKDYKSNGGTLTWNEFQKQYKNIIGVN